jgi:hypothetical protein
MGQPNAALMKTGASSKLGANANPSVKTYVEKAGGAICSAIGMWQVQAMFKGLKIMGPTAVGTPGCLQGPSIEAFVKSLCPQGTNWERKMSAAVASGVSGAWSDWARSVAVPGLPWYPSFAAFPGPQAPPTPNVPVPLLALSQIGVTAVQNAMRSSIKTKAAGLSSVDLVADALAAGFGLMFPIWIAGVVVKNVLGKGPVPTFAPPYVPVGPVVMGDNIATPGHLL